MIVKYVAVDLYESPNTGTFKLSLLTHRFGGIIPLLLAESTAEYGALSTQTGKTPAQMADIIAAQFPITFTNIVMTGVFAKQEHKDGFLTPAYSGITPSLYIPEFPVLPSIGSATYLLPCIPSASVVISRAFSMTNGDAFPNNDYVAHNASDGNGIGNAFSGLAGSNSSNRAQFAIFVLEYINGSFTGRCKKCSFSYTSPNGSNCGVSVSTYGMSDTIKFLLNSGTIELIDDPTPPEPPTDDDPYADGGTSGAGGGTGTFSETGDIVGVPSLPTLSAVDTGFITLFNPTASQVKQLASYMWSSGFDLDTFKNIVANPMECILGLTIVPVNPPNAGSKAVTVGNIATDVVLPYLSSQYVAVDCGTLNVQEFWGSYLDYSPYTKMSLYLPYIGIVPLDIDDVMNASISITYHVDVLSGACVAYVLCNGTQLYTYIGQCSSNVPVTSNDFTNTVNGILGIAGNIGSLVMSGGASAPSDISGLANNAINALKPNVQKSGAMSGTGGLMGVQTPYLICQRPRQSVPEYQNTFTGYPSNITALLSELSGYTEVEKIHLEGVPCTNEEMEEIMQLLESGVYI